MQTNKSQDVTNQEYQEFMLMFEQMRAQGLNPRVCDTPVPYYENKVPAHKRPAEARELRRMEVQSFRHNGDHVEEEDKTRNDSFLVNGTSPILINESGFYALILSSKLPKAREFKHWVTSEVLPAIRLQGGYMVARPEESDEVILARALQIMHATLQRKEEQIARLQPRAEGQRLMA